MAPFAEPFAEPFTGPFTGPVEAPVRRVAEAADPVAAFLDAHEGGAPVALPTSGSTALPRVVVRSTRSWTDSFPHVQALAGLDASSRVWVPGPLTSTMNLFTAVHARFLGAALAAGPEDATHAVLTPAALDRVLGPDLSGVVAIVAGDGLSPGLHRRATDSGVRVCHYYGAAELSFVAWGPHRDALRAFPGVDVHVRDGVIWVRSPYLCAGYQAGAGSGPLRFSADGFATVGDRGAMADGVLTVLGRDDAVTTAGATVRMGEVEAVLRRAAHGELVVVGVPDPRLGAVLGVVLTHPSDLQPVRSRARAELTGAERPRLWFHVPRLPLTAAGKLDRPRLEAGLGTAERLS